MIVLGIETSCDETAVALVADGREVLASVVASQIAAHAPFGGVVPEIAAREHLKSIYPLYEQVLTTSGCRPAAVDLIAVTQGPGLIGALLVGVSFAKGLARALQRPLVPVDHVHAHVHGALLGLSAAELAGESGVFPCLALVVSGGHSNLYFMAGPTSFQLLAATIDDACGESFDKVAKLLGLSYPGGPAIEQLARTGNPSQFVMPRMVAEKSRLAFSYSGLKTHMVQLCRKLGPLTAHTKADLCAAFQEEALGQLVRKLDQARQICPEPPRALLVAGGVAANQRFRELVAETLPLRAYFPKLAYCADNAAMIAALGFAQYREQQGRTDFFAHSWDAYSRYRFEDVSGPLPTRSR